MSGKDTSDGPHYNIITNLISYAFQIHESDFPKSKKKNKSAPVLSSTFENWKKINYRIGKNEFNLFCNYILEKYDFDLKIYLDIENFDEELFKKELLKNENYKPLKKSVYEDKKHDLDIFHNKLKIDGGVLQYTASNNYSILNNLQKNIRGQYFLYAYWNRVIEDEGVEPSLCKGLLVGILNIEKINKKHCAIEACFYTDKFNWNYYGWLIPTHNILTIILERIDTTEILIITIPDETRNSGTNIKSLQGILSGCTNGGKHFAPRPLSSPLYLEAIDETSLNNIYNKCGFYQDNDLKEKDGEYYSITKLNDKTFSNPVFNKQIKDAISEKTIII